MNDFQTYTQFSEEYLENIRKYASLRYTIGEIAMLIGVEPSELHVRMNNHSDAFFKAYTAGKLESQMKYRERILALAEGGDPDSITILEGWGRRQKEEEVGGYE